MDSYYLMGAATLSAVTIFLAALRLKDREYRKLLYECQQMKATHDGERSRLAAAEDECERLKNERIKLLRWKSYAQDLLEELRAAKRAAVGASTQRLEPLQGKGRSGEHPEILFAATFSLGGVRTFEDRLLQMVKGAELEVVIVSPWIKRSAWNLLREPLWDFSRRGGSLVVFTRGDEADYAAGMSDDISSEVKEMGGEMFFLSQLHAKVYLVDRQEVMVASANLTRGGMEANCEAGVWSDNPALIEEVLNFVTALSQFCMRT